MGHLLSPTERTWWLVAILGVAAMGAIAFGGPFHLINKPAAAPHYPPVTVRWLTDPKIIARNVPDPVRVHVGQPVIWVNRSNAPHTATAQNGAFNSGNVDVGAQWKYIPTKAGTYHYFCVYHPLMHGVLIVTR
jgi:hypothetical protein